MGLVHAEPHWLSELGGLRACASMAATKVGVLVAWISSFQGEAGELVLLLELARRRLEWILMGGTDEITLAVFPQRG